MIPIRRLKQSITQIDFGAIVEELSNDYGITYQQIEDLTGISNRYIETIKTGNEAANEELNKSISLLDVYLMIAKKSPPTY